MELANTPPVATDDFLFRDTFAVNDLTRWAQDSLHMETLSDGRVLTLWQSNTSASSANASIFGRIFNPDGTEAVAPFLLEAANGLPGRASIVGVEPLDNGHFAVILSSGIYTYSNNSSETEIRPVVQVFDAAGVPVAPPVALTEVKGKLVGIVPNPEIASLSDGRFVVVNPTSERFQTNWELEAQIFEADGTPSGAPIPLSTPNGALQIYGFTVLQDDRLVLRWYDQVSENREFTYVRYEQTFDLDGAPGGPENIIENRTSGEMIALPNGNFLAIEIVIDDPTGTQYYRNGVTANIYDPEGTLVNATPLNQDTGNDEKDGSADILANGQIVVVWTTRPPRRNDEATVSARILEADGTPTGDVFTVAEQMFGTMFLPVVRALDNGGFVVSWQNSSGIADTDRGGIEARIFNADGTPADRATPEALEAYTREGLPVLIAADDLLRNDTDGDSDTLSIIAVSNKSVFGATLTLRADGSVIYDPTTSAAIEALDTGETLEDSFTYTLSDGSAQSSATVSLGVMGQTEAEGGADYFAPAKDDSYFLSVDDLEDAGNARIRLGGFSDGYGLLENDEINRDTVFIDGSILAINNYIDDVGVWFDGNAGGQFRVFANGSVDFRNQGTPVSPGDTTGFSYITHNSPRMDTATVTLKIEADALAGDDEFQIAADALATAGRGWFRLGAQNDKTDLLQNDFGADEIVFADDAPIDEGAWFDGNGGGQFRVFKGGVLDFRNQGDIVAPGDSTGFNYTMRTIEGELEAASVSLTFDYLEIA